MLLLLACGCVRAGTAAAGAVPSQSGKGHSPAWRELKSAHYVLSTDLDPKRARETILQLEFVRSSLLRILGAELPPQQMEVVAFSTGPDYATYQMSAKSHAHYSFASDGEERIVMWADLDQARRVVVSHEVVHSVAFHVIPRQPLWFAEGLAQFLASDSGYQPGAGEGPRGPMVGARGAWIYTTGKPPHEGYLEIWRRRPVSVRQALEWRAGEHPESEGALYVRSWVLVHFLANRRPDAFHELQARFADGEDPRLAWNSVFPDWSLEVAGATEQLDHELDRYQTSPAASEIHVQVEPDQRLEERLLTEEEGRGLRLELPRTWAPQALEQELEAVLASDPGNVRALMLRADLPHADLAALTRRAVEAHPEDGGAWAFFGRQGLPPGDHAGRVEAFRKAVERAPENPAFELYLAAELLASDRPEEALRLSEEVLRQVPFSPIAPYYLAQALVALGRCTEASLSADRAWRLANDDRWQRRPLLPRSTERLKDACVEGQRRSLKATSEPTSR